MSNGLNSISIDFDISLTATRPGPATFPFSKEFLPWSNLPSSKVLTCLRFKTPIFNSLDFNCNHCGEAFQNYNGLRAHRDRVHVTEVVITGNDDQEPIRLERIDGYFHCVCGGKELYSRNVECRHRRCYFFEPEVVDGAPNEEQENPEDPDNPGGLINVNAQERAEVPVQVPNGSPRKVKSFSY